MKAFGDFSTRAADRSAEHDLLACRGAIADRFATLR